MRFLTVSSVCGFDLETSGILLGIFNLVSSFAFVTDLASSSFLLTINRLVTIMAAVSWLIGIRNRNPNFMVYNVLWSAVYTTIAFISLSLMTFNSLFVGSKTAYAHFMKKQVGRSGIESDEDQLLMIDGINKIVWTAVACYFVIQWYFLAAKYSLYKSMKSIPVEQFSMPKINLNI